MSAMGISLSRTQKKMGIELKYKSKQMPEVKGLQENFDATKCTC